MLQTHRIFITPARPGHRVTSVKGQSFPHRLGFAIAGLRTVYRREPSFRTQLCVAAVTTVVLMVLQPTALWIALVILAIGLVLAAEALNAAIEYLADALHPQHHPLIGAAKDAAASAVLIASLAALGIGLAAAYSSLP